jgi:hypothetical protein
VINHFFADARCFYEMHRPEPRDNLVIAAREIMDGAELMPEWTVRMNAGIVAANTLIIPNAAFSDADPLAVVREFCHRAIQDARDNTAAVQVNDYRRPDEMNNVLQADRDRVLSAYDVITHAWGGDATREVRDGYRDTLRAQVDVEHANLVDLNNARGMETREVLRDVHPIVVQTAVARVTRRAVRERFWGKDCPKAWYMNHKLVQKIGRSIVVRVNGEHVPGNWEAIEGASGEPYGRDWANEWDEGRDQPYDMHRVNVLWNDILNVQGRSVDEIRHIVNQRFGV